MPPRPARRHGGRQHLRRHRRGRAPGAPDDPQARRERPEARLVVTGCAAQIDPAALRRHARSRPGAGQRREADARELCALPRGARPAVGDIMAEQRRPPMSSRPGRPAPSSRCSTAATIAAPSASSRSGAATVRSVPGADRRAGPRAGRRRYREVVLTGVDLTSYGATCRASRRSGSSCRAAALVPELTRLRLSSLDPAAIDDELLAR